ncbi:Thioredoxin [Drechslerella dactyloides]|uniref:protein disulfide-isomerase n=1 Tax=Drechslerella dactyloides TaxID=74499 RepID=A0AAD6NKW1_DREDA|nr:Thioredoxin [Drechslerella dactyloides]
MKLLLTAASGLLYAALAVASANVVELTPDNFDEVITNSGKPALVKFFAPWCGHCKTLAPVFEELGDAFAQYKDKVVIAKLDADAHRNLGKKFDVRGFPTLKWFDGKSKEPVTYDSGRTLEALTEYVTTKTGIKLGGKGGAKKQAVGAVKVLTDANFDATIQDKSKSILVKFYAPWCGHCKKLAPIYEKVASAFVREPSVVVAEMDCDSPGSKATCEQYGIQGYPTLKFFAAAHGDVSTYEGGREEVAIIDYLNEHAETHRTPGGGLNSEAGTLDLMDEMLRAKVRDSIHTLEEDLKLVANVIIPREGQEKYREYYLKVAKKLQDKATYVTEELARLTKMVSKGGLNAEKLDDITKRQNILRRFVESAEAEDADAKESSAPVKDEL